MPITINDCMKCGKLPDFDIETVDRDGNFSEIVLLCRCTGYHTDWSFGDPEFYNPDESIPCADETEQLKRAIENWNTHNPRGEDADND